MLIGRQPINCHTLFLSIHCRFTAPHLSTVYISAFVDYHCDTRSRSHNVLLFYSNSFLLLVVRTVAAQQEGPGFDPWVHLEHLSMWSLYVVPLPAWVSSGCLLRSKDIWIRSVNRGEAVRVMKGWCVGAGFWGCPFYRQF